MCLRLLAAIWLLQLAQASLTNTIATASPSSDATIYDYRSVWSLLGSCGLTILICVWHAIHPTFPLPDDGSYKSYPQFRRWARNVLHRLALMALAFFVPEFIMMLAGDEWKAARDMTKRIRKNTKYKDWWRMAHSHFLLNGGLALADGKDITEIKVEGFVSFVEGETASPVVRENKSGDEGNRLIRLITPALPNDIVNSVITEDEIKDKGTSDALAKAILIVQLSWFTIQVAVRLANHLTITLIELDTVCLTVLTLPLLYFWWNKPRCAATPYIFYTRNYTGHRNGGSQQKNDDVTHQAILTIRTNRGWADLISPMYSSQGINYFILFLAWTVFGALHMIAWNYPFPTAIETMLWRVSSLTLAGGPLALLTVLAVGHFTENLVPNCVQNIFGLCMVLVVIASPLSRLLLVALMLASLRSLPPDAYLVIPWTEYIPHL